MHKREYEHKYDVGDVVYHILLSALGSTICQESVVEEVIAIYTDDSDVHFIKYGLRNSFNKTNPKSEIHEDDIFDTSNECYDHAVKSIVKNFKNKE